MISNTFNVMQMNNSSSMYNEILSERTITQKTSSYININLLNYNNIFIKGNCYNKATGADKIYLCFNNCTLNQYGFSIMIRNRDNDRTISAPNVSGLITGYSTGYNKDITYEIFLKKFAHNTYNVYINNYYDLVDIIWGTINFTAEPTTIDVMTNVSNSSSRSTNTLTIYGAK